MNTGYNYGGTSSPNHPPQQNVQVTEQQIRQYENRFEPVYDNIKDIPANISSSRQNVRAYGAVGDGESHPLSDYYGTLEEAQAVYPKALALTDEIDWASIQTSIDDAAYVWIPNGAYRINRPIIVPSSRTVRGTGLAQTQLHWYGGPDAACVQVGTQSGEFESTSNVTLEDFYIAIPTNAETVSGGIGLDLRSVKWNNTFSRIRIGDNSLRPFGIGLKMGEFTFINNFYHIVSARNTVNMHIGAVSNTNFFFGGSLMNGGKGVEFAPPGADSSTHPAANNWSFFGTNFEGNSEEGVYGGNSGVGTVLLSGCRFEGNNRDVVGGSQVHASNATGWVVDTCHFSGGNAIERALDFFNSNVVVRGCREISHTVYFVAHNQQNGKCRVEKNWNTTPNQVSTITETTKEYVGRMRGSTQSIPNATWTKVDFSVALEGNDFIVDLTNNELVFRRDMTGVVDFYALFAPNGTGARLARLQRNRGGVVSTLAEFRSDAQANTGTAVGIDTAVPAQDGDKLYLEVYQNSTAALNLEYYADWSLVFGFRSTHVA